MSTRSLARKRTAEIIPFVMLVAGTAALSVLLSLDDSVRGRFRWMQICVLIFLTLTFFRAFKHRGDEVAPTLIWPWLAMITGVLTWITMLDIGFVADDFNHLAVAKNATLGTVWELMRYGQNGSFLRPIGSASIFAEYHLWGNAPVGYHATNLALHVGSACGLYLITFLLGKDRAIAAVTAGIFVAMPVQVEAVAWLGARFDVLATFLGIWSIAAYVWARIHKNLPVFFVALALYFLAVLTKETAFMVPFILAAIEWFILRPARLWHLYCFFGLGITVFAYRLFVLNGIGGYASDGGLGAFDISPLDLANRLVLRGPGATLAGINWTYNDNYVIFAAAAIATILIPLSFATRPANRGKEIAVGAVWMAVTMLPAHFMLLIGGDMTKSRVLYMGSAGGAIILGQVLGSVPAGKFKNVAWIALVVALDLCVLHNITAWRFTTRLSTDMLSDLRRNNPEPSPGTVFIINGLPETVRGVYFLHVGLNEAVRMEYGRDDVSALRAGETLNVDNPQYVSLDWDPITQKLEPASPRE